MEQAAVGTVLAVFAVKKLAHGLAPGLVGFSGIFAFERVHGTLVGGLRIGSFGLAAGGTTVGETRLVGLQLELFGTDDANSNWKRHFGSIINPFLELIQGAVEGILPD